MTPAQTPAGSKAPVPPSPATEAPGSASDDERLADLADEFFLRHRRGEGPSVEDYAKQNPSLAGRVRELFPGLLALEQSEPGSDVRGDPATEPLGKTVGRYKLLERLGEGGFGVVFLAEQLTPVRRKVALKVIKPGLDTQQVIARFGAERQALALMDHENIARVLDAGATDSGRPYFVMELVDGVPITDYCEKYQLAPRQRLELFVRVCGAVQHAHTKGIIHRDLKPTNVLVAVHDGLPVPKVIDFGVAKATAQQQLTDGTLFTNVAQIVGTPLYMSPEQAEMSGQDVDTRSDVYSLGVLLYELLTGTTPVDKDRLKQAAFDEVRRIIREEEPPRPSTRFGVLGARLPAGSMGRRGELKKLGQLVRGELDWIVMKALEKDRSRRYETVSGLAADVGRYLNDETVHACPPSATYRARKLLRRHKGPVTAASVVALALVGGIIGTTWGMLRAREQQFLALVSQAHAERVSGRAGQRFGSLRTIAKAARFRVTQELRDEAAAALALPDMELAQEWDDADKTDPLAISFDGAAIHYARASQQGAVTIGRVTGGREVAGATLAARERPVVGGPWWSDHRRFLAYVVRGADDNAAGALRVWKVDGPTPTVVLDEPTGVSPSAFAFRAGGRKCAFAHAAGGVTVIDLDTGEGRVLPAGKVTALAFHPSDGRLALVCGAVVQIFDSNTGHKLNPLRPAETTAGIRCIAWHPDGRRMAMAFDSQIHVFDVDSGGEVLPPGENRAEFERIGFTHAGDRLLSRDGSNQALLWDVASRKQVLATPAVLEVNWTFSPDDRFVGFSRGGGKVRVWRFESGRELRMLANPGVDHRPDSLYGRAFDGTGRIFAAGSVGGERLSFLDIETGEELARISVPPGSAQPFDFDNVVGGWFTGGTPGVMVWPVRSEPGRPASLRVGPPQTILPGPGNAYWGFSGAGDGGRVVAITDVNSTILIRRGLAGPHLTLGPQPRMRNSEVSPDGKWVATCSDGSDGLSKSVRIWDGRDGRLVAILPLSGSHWNSTFSPDSRWLTTYDQVEESQVWKVGSWKRPVASYPAGRIIFSPDSRLMALNNVIGCLRLLKVASGEEVARVAGPELRTYWPQCFTPDGTKLLAMGDGMCMWDLRLIREQLSAMGLDWDHPNWPPFPPAVGDPRGRLRLTVDTGAPAPEAPVTPPPRPHEPTTESRLH